MRKKKPSPQLDLIDLLPAQLEQRTRETAARWRAIQRLRAAALVVRRRGPNQHSVDGRLIGHDELYAIARAIQP